MEVWYGPDRLDTLNPGSSGHLSWADSVWLIARMLANEALQVARMLAENTLHIARMLANGAWFSLLHQYYGDALLPKVVEVG